MRAVWMIAVIAAVTRAASAQPAPPQVPTQATDPYVADPATATTAPDAARGWARPPEGSRIVVFGAIGRGLQIGARFVVDVIAAPFRGIAWLEDRHRVLTRVREVFYNDAHTAGVLPAVALESGFGVMFGASAFHSDLFGHGERAAASATYGGSNRYAAQLKFERRRRWSETGPYFIARGRYEAADNLLFAGIGNAMDGGALAPNGETRYGERRWLATASSGVQLAVLGGQLRLGATYIFNDGEFDQDVASGDTPIGDVYDVAQLAGFGGIQLHEVTGDVELDLRDRDGASSSGVRIAGFGGGAFGDPWQFAHWGAEVTVYLTPWRARRTFLLRVANEGVQGDVPFTDLPRLGGPGLLRGYRRDQFRDDTMALATLEYRYPIHGSVSGALFVESGKVAPTYDALASTADWHVGYGGGLIVQTRDSIALTLQLAYGDGVQLYATTDVWQAFRKRTREL